MKKFSEIKKKALKAKKLNKVSDNDFNTSMLILLWFRMECLYARRTNKGE